MSDKIQIVITPERDREKGERVISECGSSDGPVALHVSVPLSSLPSAYIKRAGQDKFLVFDIELKGAHVTSFPYKAGHGDDDTYSEGRGREGLRKRANNGFDIGFDYYKSDSDEG